MKNFNLDPLFFASLAAIMSSRVSRVSHQEDNLTSSEGSLEESSPEILDDSLSSIDGSEPHELLLEEDLLDQAFIAEESHEESDVTDLPDESFNLSELLFDENN